MNKSIGNFILTLYPFSIASSASKLLLTFEYTSQPVNSSTYLRLKLFGFILRSKFFLKFFASFVASVLSLLRNTENQLSIYYISNKSFNQMNNYQKGDVFWV